MTVKRKSGKALVLIAMVALIAGLVFVGKQYYEDRYVGTDYYTMIPLDYDVTPEPLRSDSGEDLGPGKVYALTIHNEQGESKTITLTAYGPTSPAATAGPLPQPGDYVRVQHSKQMVTGWNIVLKSQVPHSILRMIAGSS